MDFQPCKTNEGSDASKGEPAIFAGGVESKPSGSDLSKAPPTEISKALTNNPHGTSSPTMRKSRGLFFFRHVRKLGLVRFARLGDYYRFQREWLDAFLMGK